MKNLEAKTAHGRLEVEDVPVGPPHFVTELIGQTEMAEGQIAHFEAQIEPIHDSGLTVEFLHNNRPLKQASRIHTLCDFGYVALDIGQLIESDAEIDSEIIDEDSETGKRRTRKKQIKKSCKMKHPSAEPMLYSYSKT